ncbi:coiled-coil domain-containing protein 42 homolog [Ahaetulla prasina]|uniref:coiled-coil domain-containing protein 42 homolog n=1 Tax=Ahaetulla prasina TaxID=499056 RepID=UPI00264A2296|nr:coiled-coil domain-containing protein 42 homolog [Ahaetulla prasina]
MAANDGYGKLSSGCWDFSKPYPHHATRSTAIQKGIVQLRCLMVIEFKQGESASSELPHTSRTTLQQLRLLKKKAKNDIVTADLIAKKHDVKMRMDRVAECREELQQKDQNNRAQALGFQIYLQDCDHKKERALAKHKIEQTNNALKRKEIRRLKRELQKLKVRQQELQKKIAKYKSYEHFLKKIVNLLPPDFWGYQEDSVIKTLTQRHKTLSSINQNLKNRLLSQEENVEIMHHKCAATQEEHNTMRFVMLPILDYVVL